MTNYCSFFGHRDFSIDEDMKTRIKSEIKWAIHECDITDFLLGGYGKFDYACTAILREIKTEFPYVRSHLVIAYLDKKLTDYDKIYIKENFDSVVYPPIENTPKKFAILKRNEWILDNSEYIIFYVDHSFGGANKMLQRAIKKKKSYVNLGIKKEL